jgi:hypothetical protein
VFDPHSDQTALFFFFFFFFGGAMIVLRTIFGHHGSPAVTGVTPLGLGFHPLLGRHRRMAQSAM